MSYWENRGEENSPSDCFLAHTKNHQMKWQMEDQIWTAIIIQIEETKKNAKGSKEITAFKKKTWR